MPKQALRFAIGLLEHEQGKARGSVDSVESSATRMHPGGGSTRMEAWKLLPAPFYSERLEACRSQRAGITASSRSREQLPISIRMRP